jgi:hypothetical protein
MKLFHSFLSVFPLALLLFSVSVFCEEKTKSPSPIETIGKDTEWLNADYLKTLKETKSTFKASKDIYYSAMIFKLNQKTVEWMQCYNFHEGLGYIIEYFGKNGEVYYPVFSPEQWSAYVTKENTFVFSGNPVDKIEWSFVEIYNNPGEQKHLTFVRAEPDIKTIINSLTIAGNYKDNKGLRYSFSEDGKAVWPDRSFDYEVIPDNVLTNYDYFMTSAMIEKNRHETKGFEWKDGNLFIFNITDTGETDTPEKDNKPFLVLTPVK